MLKNYKRTTGDEAEISGVCGGLAKSLDTNPGILRVIAILGAFASFGIAVLIYVLMVMFTEEE